ncbi:MAG: ABC transporter permease, partial [Firmicutes bacterium]|nr:ABC transporter permease [Bacillota bacterium]
MKHYMKNPNFRLGAIITGIMILLIVVGAFWTPYDPNAMDASCKMQGPSFAHILGTDNFGRDVFSRVVQGAGATFMIAAATVAIGLLI